MQRPGPTLILWLTLLAGCAQHPGLSEKHGREALLDSARTLVRRGMTDEARARLEALAGAPSMDRFRPALFAACAEKEADWMAAAHFWKIAAWSALDSASHRIAYWKALARWGEADTSRRDSLLGIVRDEGARFAAGNSPNELYLGHAAALIASDTTAEARGDRLIEAFPDSQVSIDLVGSRFWDGLYPIWDNDSVKALYLREFIRRYDRFSWRDTAWRTLINSLIARKDTAAAIAECEAWIIRSPTDPSPLLIASNFAYSLYGAEDERTDHWADAAYANRDKLARPSHIPTEEWLLYGPATKAGIPLQLGIVKLDRGEIEAAKKLAEESLALAQYGVDEYATPAPQHLLLGRVARAMGDSADAARHWTETLVQGDVVNLNAGRAADSLKAMFGLKDDAALLDFCRRTSGYDGIVFSRVTDSVGLGEVRGGRVAWGDFDNDSDDDLLAGGSKLYQNDKGEFKDVTEEAGLKAEGCHGGVWGDYDNDGDLDLSCFSSSSDRTRAERLFRNNNGRFDDVTVFSPDLPDSFSTEAAIWFDANGDGRHDLYIPGYERPAKGANDLGKAWPSRLLVQDKEGVFHDSTTTFGLIPPGGRNLCGRSPVACDFDRDGDQDLYVGNYRLQENQFWVNNQTTPSAPPSIEGGVKALSVTAATSPPSIEGGDKGGIAPRFTNLAAYFQVDGEEHEGWWGHTIGCQWGDFDGDGDFDIIVCNLAHPRYIGFSNRTLLYRNDGPDAPFAEVRREWGIKYEECHSEPVWGDFDNDGDLDLYITCVYPNRRSFLYRNDGDHFTDITFLAGVRTFNGWGCATADYDSDGNLDLAVCAGGKVELFRNETKGGAWVEIAPDRNPGEHLSAIGGIAAIEAGGRKFVRQFEGGKGAGSQNSPTLHFGLGKAASCRLTVAARGKEMHFEQLRAGQRFEIGKETVGVGVGSGR